MSEEEKGKDVKTCDMFKTGIIDPTKVTICALQNAASVACALIMSNCAIIEN